MIFLELVPRDLNNIIETCHWVKLNQPEITGINIPDILRVENRSYDTCIQLAEQNFNVIPHIRIIDFSEKELIELTLNLYSKNVTKILLISGDPPLDLSKPIYNHNIKNIIKLIKKEVSEMTIYAGLDPYRQNLKKEIEYSHTKIEAGATGLFTQPIFDINLAHILINQPFNCDLFIGISPVTDERSYQYWCNRNQAFFPKSFELTLSHNITVAKSIIELCSNHNQHNYLMPIKTTATDYLKELFK
jgi:methylenetetrahydrofolate reductase (NADPH)